jgi:hypothetical protein
MLFLRPALVVVVALPLTACDVRVGEQGGVSVGIVEGRASDEWVRAYSLAAGGELAIVNPHGPIDVFPAAGSEVEVRARREVRARSDEAAQELLKQVAISETVSPDRITIETAEPRGEGFRPRVTVTYRVNTPPGLTLSLRSQNGGVRLENVAGRFTAATTNGTITGRGVSGALHASTVNGGIVVDIVRVDDDVRLTTVNGGVRLDVGPGVNATLEASAVNGGVVVREGFPLQATERARLRVAGRINAGGPAIVVQTTNGGIVIGGGRGAGRGDTEVLERELRER